MSDLAREREVSKILYDALQIASHCEGFQNWGAGGDRYELGMVRTAIALYEAHQREHVTAEVA